MATFSQTLLAVTAAVSKNTFAEAVKNCDGAPSPATIRQIVDIAKNKPVLALSQAQKNALDLVVQFANRPGAIRYTHLQRTRVALQLIARVLYPGLINQGSFGMCGPAAVAIDTASSNPLEYVVFAISLCENGNGSIGGRRVSPVPSIFTYHVADDQLTGMPQADWVVMVALRDDKSNLENSFAAETYGGATGNEMFSWLIKCGFTKVIHMSHIMFGNFFEFHPGNLLPPGISLGDKMRTLTTAADLCSRGWRIFMQAFMQLSKSVEAYKKIDDMEALIGAPMVPQRTAQATALATENPGGVGTIFNVVKSTFGFSGGDTRHWTFVEAIAINQVNQTVTITCSNHGITYPNVVLPLAGFLNKFLGFVAASDYA